MCAPPLGSAITPPLMRLGAVTRPGTFAMGLLLRSIGTAIIAAAADWAIARGMPGYGSRASWGLTGYEPAQNLTGFRVYSGKIGQPERAPSGPGQRPG